MKAEDRGQLVRGKVVAGYWRAGCIDSTVKTLEEADKRNNALAVTPWYRHDDLERCDAALKLLVKCYSDMPGTECITYGYEYREYGK